MGNASQCGCSAAEVISRDAEAGRLHPGAAKVTSLGGSTPGRQGGGGCCKQGCSDSDDAADNGANCWKNDLRTVAREEDVPREAMMLASPKSGSAFQVVEHAAPCEDTDTQRCATGHPRESRFKKWKMPITFFFLMISTVVASAFIEDGTPQLFSVLSYGTIPVIAAIIGYVTNVLALEMMFLPIEFIGFFPNLKIGCGLDLPLCGWQGVIPMKAKAMAEISVTLMTAKLIRVDEIFARLDPDQVASEVGQLLPDTISTVIETVGRRHFPKLWEYLPANVRKQVKDRVVADSRNMLAKVFLDMQDNIQDVFDLRECVVKRLTENKALLNEMFRNCGKEEFVFIRQTGFYLGFLLGCVQMGFWVFFKHWWVLPLCGVFVGWVTNEVALRVIFSPVEPVYLCRGRVRLQGLFMIRQQDVAALYSQMVATRVISAEVLLTSLVTGPKAELLYELVDKHVAASVEEQGASYKHAFLVSIGAEAWVEFREGICKEFRKKLPALLMTIHAYAQDAMQLEETMRSRLRKLPPRDFERLLHAVFEQDEIKLILVGALLGFLVGFAQAAVQTPEQLGLA